MSNARLIIGDADAIIALSSDVDANHERAKRIVRHFTTVRASILFPVTAICEATTAIQRKFGNPEAADHIVRRLQEGSFATQSVDRDTLLQALTLFHPHGSKQNTLFDAVVAAVAWQTQADAIFSFDRWYKKIGFSLAGDLLPVAEAA